MSSIRIHEARGFLVIDISGRLSPLGRDLREAVQRSLVAGHRQFILKMNAVSYIDSCGLGQLVCIYTSVRTSGGNVRLLAPSQRVRELLDITKLDTIFEILEDTTPFADRAAPARVNTFWVS
jgi:anti-sigma B factor antagonist